MVMKLVMSWLETGVAEWKIGFNPSGDLVASHVRGDRKGSD